MAEGTHPAAAEQQHHTGLITTRTTPNAEPVVTTQVSLLH